MNIELEKNLIQRVAVGDIIRRSALRYPHKEAVVENRGGKDIRLTYSQLNAKTNQLARAFRGLGLAKGDRVAVLCANSTEFIITIFGLAKGGFVCIPVNPGLSPVDIAYILNHAEAKAMVFDDLFIHLVQKINSQVPGVKHYISIPFTGVEIPQPFQDFEHFLKAASDREVEDVIIQDRDLLQIMYTSGTTAAPKGVMISHLSVFVASLSNLPELGINRNSVLSMLMPLFHCAQHTTVVSAMHVGAKVVVMRGFDGDLLLETIQQEKITGLFMLPLMFRALMEHSEFAKYDLSSLEYCIYAMTPMDRRTLEEAIERFKCRFYLGTGQTECYPVTNLFLPEWQLLKRGNYWGTSSAIFDTAVMDDKGNLLPPNQVGEIVWRSPAVMEGYLKDEAATAESRKFGWHHSGDLGYFDEDGLLVFVDRKKDTIKTGGENVPSIKVEQVIQADPRVQGVAVVGLPHPRWIEGVTAFVIPRPEARLTEEDILDVCRKSLGKFEVPKAVVFVDDLPRTATGKIQKHVIRKQYQEFYAKN